jgi:hypothetical protein
MQPNKCLSTRQLFPPKKGLKLVVLISDLRTDETLGLQRT